MSITEWKLTCKLKIWGKTWSRRKPCLGVSIWTLTSILVGICRLSAWNNSIYCSWKNFVREKCNSIRGKLVEDEHFRFRCRGQTFLDVIVEVVLPDLLNGALLVLSFLGNLLEIIDIFCYFRDTVQKVFVNIVHACSGWGKARELLSFLTDRYIHIKACGRIFDICVRSVLLYGSQFLAKVRLDRNDRAMLRWNSVWE